MITAHQAARLQVAQDLLDARRKLLGVQHSALFTADQSREVGDIVARIDALFAVIIPNQITNGD